jgi:hypothetical protein
MQKAVHSDYNKTEETIKEKIRISVDSCRRLHIVVSINVSNECITADRTV